MAGTTFTAAAVILLILHVLVESLEVSKCTADIVFVLDRSGSVRSYGYDNEKSFAMQVAKAFSLSPSGTQAGVVSFADEASIEIECNEYDNNKDFDAAVGRMVAYDEYTNIKDGLQMAKKLFNSTCNRTHAIKLCFLLTDGIANIDDYPYEMAATLRGMGVHLYVIGIGAFMETPLGRKELNLIAGDSGKVFRSGSYERLSEKVFVYSVIEHACPDPLLPSQQPAYLDCLETPTDICLILDQSGSVKTEWKSTKLFAKQIVKSLKVSTNGANVGIVTFATSAKTRVYLDECENSFCVNQKIDEISDNPGGFTNLNAALIKARDEVLWNQARGGMRVVNGVDASQHVILISDGAPTSIFPNGKETADNIKRRGGEITVLAIGNKPELKFLLEIADGPENFLEASDFDQLLRPDFLQQFMKEVCTRRRK